jgi:hypothetical protein
MGFSSLASVMASEGLQVETRKIQIPKRGCNIQDWQPDTSGFFDGLKLPPKLSIQ